MVEAKHDRPEDLPGPGGAGPEPADGAADPPVTIAYRSARELLDGAAEEAARIMAEAASTARAREQEAALLVAKARRLLEAAEAKASVILAAARAEASGASVLDLTDQRMGRVVAPGATVLPRGSLAARIDEIVAGAVAQAIQEARPDLESVDAVS